MKPSFFSNPEKEQRIQAKAACGIELVQYAGKCVDKQAEELRQRAKEAGLNEQETEDYVEEVKHNVETRILKEYLKKAEEIDEKLERQALNKGLSPK